MYVIALFNSILYEFELQSVQIDFKLNKKRSKFLMVVRVETDSTTAKPYIPQKSLFQGMFSKFFVM